MKLQPEPDNQFDCKAIAIITAVEDKWERIGYMVKEALDDVHEAINNNKILSVSFAWLKYRISIIINGVFILAIWRIFDKTPN